MGEIVTSIHGREIGLDAAGQLVVRNGIVGLGYSIPRLAGDNTTDDWKAIQDAITAVGAAGGGVVILPGDATYRVTQTIVMANNVVLKGQGGSKPVIRLVSSSVARLFNFTSVSNGGLEDLALNGASASNSGSFVVLSSATNNRIARCDFTSGTDNTNIGSVVISGTSSGNIIEDCTSTSCQGTAFGITGANAKNNVIRRCAVTSSVGFGVRIGESASGNLVSQIRTTSNGIELIGIATQAFANRIEECHAEGCGDNGISVSGDYNVVVGNLCQGNLNAGIGVWGSYNTVTGNVCRNNRTGAASTWSGIWLQANYGGRGSYNSIVGNECDDSQAAPTQAYGIRIEGSGYTTWANGQSITIGNYRVNGLNLYQATTAGTTGVTAPVHTSGTASDGGVTWSYVSSFLIAARPEGNTSIGNTLGRSATATYSDFNQAADNIVIDRTVDMVLPAKKLLIGSAIPITYTSANGVQVSAGSGSPGINLETTNSASVAAITAGLSDAQRGRLEYSFTNNVWDVYVNGAQAYRAGATNFRAASDNTIDLGTSTQRFKIGFVYSLNMGSSAVTISTGSGTPEGVVTAPVGSLFLRTNGGAATTLYVKESGAGNTGWIAK